VHCRGREWKAFTSIQAIKSHLDVLLNKFNAQSIKFNDATLGNMAAGPLRSSQYDITPLWASVCATEDWKLITCKNRKIFFLLREFRLVRGSYPTGEVSQCCLLASMG